MNKTTIFDELDLLITETSSLIGGIWESETNLVPSEYDWFESIYLDVTMHDDPFVIDVGSSTGLLSLFNKNLGFPIFSFEPNRLAFNELLQNVRLNSCNTLCYNLALGDKCGQTYLTEHPELWGYGYNRILDTPTNHPIEIQRLDTLIPINAKVSHVKIDVEGYEIFVLKGMERILSQKPVLYLEMIENNLSNYGYQSLEIFHLLDSYGYEGTQIDQNNFKFV